MNARITWRCWPWRKRSDADVEMSQMPASQSPEAREARKMKRYEAYISNRLRQIKEAEKAEPVPRRVLDAYITTLVVIVFLAHPLITKQALSMVSCMQFDIGDGQTVSYIADDLSISCDEDPYTSYFIGAMVVFVVFSLGAPLTFLAILIYHRKRLHRLGMQRRLRYLYSGFHDRAYYWEFVILLRKAGLVLIIVFLAQKALAQVMAALWFIGLCIVVQMFVRPFRYRIVGKFDLAALIAVFITLMAGVRSDFRYFPEFVLTSALVHRSRTRTIR